MCSHSPVTSPYSKQCLDEPPCSSRVSQRMACGGMGAGVCVPGHLTPTQAHSSTDYSSLYLSQNSTLNILHLKIYCVPHHWAEGQREHFCESHLAAALHGVNQYRWILNCRGRLPSSPPQGTESGGEEAAFSIQEGHPLPLAQGHHPQRLEGDTLGVRMLTSFSSWMQPCSC